MHFKQFISHYYKLCNMVGYSLLLGNVNSDSRKILLKFISFVFSFSNLLIFNMSWFLYKTCVKQFKACMSVLRNTTIKLQKRGDSACVLPYPCNTIVLVKKQLLIYWSKNLFMVARIGICVYLKQIKFNKY